VSVSCGQSDGYLWQEGMIASPAGECRPFDHRADGSVPGGGLGVVVLKPLDRALADGDAVRAVIEATAVNNDGRTKLGFTAPSPAGQAEVIASAIRSAGVTAVDIGFVQAHGSATRLGDVVEIEALNRAFQLDGRLSGHCALGALKGNLGHLDRAAGIAGLIATVLTLEHGEIPPLAGFQAPNPELGLDRTAFYVPVEPQQWTGDTLRAGVSSFGMGGTNAHAIMRAVGR
jgi:acyl transferase domain-containing protein